MPAKKRIYPRKTGKRKRRRTRTTDEPAVEVWDDPQWEPALSALERGDPKQLSRLLCSGGPVPDQVAWRLGILLHPPYGRKGPKLTFSVNKRYSGEGELKFIRKMLDLKKKIKTARRGTKKLESAIADVMRQTGKSRAYLMEAWTFDVKKGIPLLAKYNPQKP
jgi:hypothetical protein